MKRCALRWLGGGFLGLLAFPGMGVLAQTSQPAASSEAAPAPAAEISIEALARRLQDLETRNATLAEQNANLARQLQQVTTQYQDLNQRIEHLEPDAGFPPHATSTPTPFAPGDPATVALEPGDHPGMPSVSVPAAESGTAATPSAVLSQPYATAATTPPLSDFLVGDYDEDNGRYVLVRPRDSQRVPFELRLDIFTQARYTNFTRSAPDWVDSTGTPRPIRNLSSVEINRNFFQFTGFSIDPRLQYTAVIFSSTAINDTVYLGWLNYHFSDAFDLRVGNWLLPGTREWYESFRYTLGAERLMATTYFRPNISPGIWAQGEPVEGLRYVAMVANSLNRFTQGIERTGSNPAFGGTVIWEPRKDFGLGPSDIEFHQRPSYRFGTSMAFSRETNQGLGSAIVGGQTNPEDTILRLSDGTPLFRFGALGPGTELMATNIQLWTLDAAVKYRGLSLSGEYLMRWLNGFDVIGGQASRSGVFDHGALAQAGYFLIPGKLEAYARTSFVTGPFGSGDEWGGLNWFVRDSREWRMTLEVTRINHSPAENILTGYRAGASGTLVQLQWFTDF